MPWKEINWALNVSGKMCGDGRISQVYPDQGPVQPGVLADPAALHMPHTLRMPGQPVANRAAPSQANSSRCSTDIFRQISVFFPSFLSLCFFCSLHAISGLLGFDLTLSDFSSGVQTNRLTTNQLFHTFHRQILDVFA